MSRPPFLSELTVPVRRFRPAPGRFSWPVQVRLSSASLRDRLPLEDFARDLRGRFPLPPRLVFHAAGGTDLSLRRVPGLGAEGYRIHIEPRGLRVEASADAGAYYAVQTLRELRPGPGDGWPCGRIEDSPDFPRRGLSLDCSRGRVPRTDTIRRLIEFLARHKVNELQLYIENVFRFRRHPAIGRGFDPFTPDDLLDLQEVARSRHVRLVPSFACLGHFERILALPPYRSLGELPGFQGLPGGTTLCPSDPGTPALLSDLLGEFLPLFDSEDFNACCDEPWELGKGRSRARVRRAGLGRVYLGHLLMLHRLCRKHGKRMNLWADILLEHPETLSLLPRDIVLLNWEYRPRGKRMAKTGKLQEAGLDFLVCPGTHGWQSHGSRRRISMENVRAFSAEGRRRGARGLLQTDWGDLGHRNPLGSSLHGFAHGAAHAWNGRAVDEARFTPRFARSVFGDPGGRVADALITLGRSEERTGLNLYRSLESRWDGGFHFRGIPRLSPAWYPPIPGASPWGSASVEGCRAVAEDGGRILDALAGIRPGDSFLRSILEDLRCAAALDRATARRAIVARSGIREAALLRTLREDLEEAAVRLKRSWMGLHRPSRLRDNLRMLQNALEEARPA